MILVLNEANSPAEVVASMLRRLVPEPKVEALEMELAKDCVSGRGAYSGRQRPKVILLDGNMNAAAGRNFVEWVREQKGCEDLPIVAFSYPWPDLRPKEVKAMGITRIIMLPREFERAEAALMEALAPYLVGPGKE